MKPFLPLLFAAALAAPVAASAASLPRHEAPEDAHVYIISPEDGSTVPPTFTVRFGVSGMGVAPSGVNRADTGHHHLLIDVDTLPEGSLPIPSDDQHLHFGGGQTQTVLHLEPGTHTLQLDFADANHMQFKPPLVSEKITVHVKKPQ